MAKVTSSLLCCRYDGPQNKKEFWVATFYLDFHPFPGCDDDARVGVGAGSAGLLAAAPRDRVVQRVVALAPDHLGEDAPPGVYEPVAYLQQTQRH